jgi:hypothetical protein
MSHFTSPRLTHPHPTNVGRFVWLWSLFVLSAVNFVLSAVNTALGQVDFEEPPINYLTTKSNDRVAQLIKKVEQGSVTMKYDKHFGYLGSVLERLDVPLTSQVLVFSKTSLQLKRISPRTPRAIYFDDDIYIGWCQGGDVVEISAVDPDLGGVFYTIDQHRRDKPVFKRQAYDCLQCHASSLSGGIPGHTVRSVYASASGRMDLSAKNFLTDHTSPFNKRWGGWYVTGQHGSQRHLGNLPRRANAVVLAEDDRGANVTSLADFFSTFAYHTRHSDIVALMVLEHQTTMHNLITQANYQTRIAEYEKETTEKSSNKPDKFGEQALNKRVAEVGEPLVKYLLMSGEMKITDPIKGTSGFTKKFAARGPRDDQGRSLREFDLKRRMFKYPCSYLIYSDAFDHLPDPVRNYVYRRVLEVLTGQDNGDDWKHLSATDRRAILEILGATKKGLPASYAKALSS